MGHIKLFQNKEEKNEAIIDDGTFYNKTFSRIFPDNFKQLNFFFLNFLICTKIIK